MLSKLQRQMMSLHPELENKKSILQFYVDFEFPEKQRNMLNWWSNIIETAIRLSGEVYITPADLEQVVTLHGLKPLPLLKILEHLERSQKIEWHNREKKAGQQGWFGTVKNYLWKPAQNKSNQSLQNDRNSQIVDIKYKNQMLGKIKDIIERELNGEKSIEFHYIFEKLRQQLTISEKSINFLLQDTHNNNYILIEEVQGNRILLYASQTQLRDRKWVEIEKSKYSLKMALNFFRKKIEIRQRQQSEKLLKAKNCVEHDKLQAKRIICQVKALQKVTDELENRRRLLQQTLDQLQMNESNSLLVDVMGQCQSVLQKTMVDSHEIDQIASVNNQIKENNQYISSQLEQMSDMNSSQLEKEVDSLMADLEKQISDNKKNGSTQIKFSGSQNKQIKNQNNALRPEKL